MFEMICLCAILHTGLLLVLLHMFEFKYLLSLFSTDGQNCYSIVCFRNISESLFVSSFQMNTALFLHVFKGDIKSYI